MHRTALAFFFAGMIAATSIHFSYAQGGGGGEVVVEEAAAVQARAVLQARAPAGPFPVRRWEVKGLRALQVLVQQAPAAKA